MPDGGGLYIPVAGVSAGSLADTFGAPRSGGRSHKGIDIFASVGTPVVAARGGVVVKAGDSGGLGGLRVWVRDDQGFFHYYAHLNSISVQTGQRVEGGQQLGGVGNTGNARTTPAHLHYSVNRAGHTSESGSLNPYQFLVGGGAESGGGRLEGTGTNSPMAAGSSTIPFATQGIPEVDPAEQFVDEARLNSETVENIMAAVSRAAQANPDSPVLDLKAMFGDTFDKIHGVN